MHNLTKAISSISPEIKQKISKRIKEFSSFRSKAGSEWFQELCFCILAANSRQKTAEAIEKSLNSRLLSISQAELTDFIRASKHRFHNNKARYIVEARKYPDIKDILKEKSEIEARKWLIDNIKGIGMKEASHFLRNTGGKDLAILDRHIINIMSENNLIEKPKTLTPKAYLKIEKVFNSLAKKMKMSSAELDLNLWYLKTGEVAK